MVSPKLLPLVLRSGVLTYFRDQELRFTVHDSPDYSQLKVSVFAEDKKTDLVGEAWIDLREIIIPGGGQRDVWQNLLYKGKYAGEIRIEITFYDSRPKPEKPAAKPSPAPSEQANGSISKRTPVKRRPLPSDPITGLAPAANDLPPAVPSGPEHQTPPRSQQKQISHSSYVASQSPLQAVEYNTPPTHPSRNHHPDQQSISPHTGPPQGYVTPTRGDPRQPRRSMDPYEATSPRHLEEREFSPKYPNHQLEHIDTRERHYPALPEPYEASPQEDPRQFSPMEDERPPPPPAHRSRHNSGSQELVPRNYDTSPTKLSQNYMRQEVLRNEAHRHSISSSSYPGRPTFRAYDSAPPAPNPLPPPAVSNYDSSVPRHHSYDQSYDPHHRSMQPTVEDVPEPQSQPPNTYRYSGSRSSFPAEIDYHQKDPSPAPLNLSRSPGGSPYRDEPPSQAQQGYQDQNPYQMTVSPLSNRDFANSPGQVSYHSHSSQSQNSNPRAELETTHIQSSSNYSLPSLPPSLVPGLDPVISQEITDRIYEDRRRERRRESQSMSTPTRGRQGYDAFQPYGQAQGSSPGYAPQQQSYERQQPYERRAITYNPGNEQDMQLVRRGVSPDTRTSPNPQQTIRRKSVSPIPPPVEERRHSGVPFGPDSYDAFNTSLVSTNDGNRPPGYEEAKIITHDGREIDPSDHLPMESWAPEPEHKHKEPSPEPRSRPSPAGAQPMPPSTRRTPRSGRTHAHSVSSSQPYISMSSEPHTPPALGSTGRTRLQKRTTRASMGPSPGASSPLAPISPDNYQDRGSPYTPTRGLPRASTWDHQNENRSPYSSGPPIPAKIPLPLMSGANGVGTELALMEEMQRIDIGSGRSRRRGGY